MKTSFLDDLLIRWLVIVLVSSYYTLFALLLPFTFRRAFAYSSFSVVAMIFFFGSCRLFSPQLLFVDFLGFFFCISLFCAILNML